jgi:hypothetical protein
MKARSFQSGLILAIILVPRLIRAPMRLAELRQVDVGAGHRLGPTGHILLGVAASGGGCRDCHDASRERVDFPTRSTGESPPAQRVRCPNSRLSSSGGFDLATKARQLQFRTALDWKRSRGILSSILHIANGSSLRLNGLSSY